MLCQWLCWPRHVDRTDDCAAVQFRASRSTLRDSPEDCGVDARANGCPGRPCADAVLAVLAVHAQPVEGMRAQQRQRMRHCQAHICMPLIGAPLSIPPPSRWLTSLPGNGSQSNSSVVNMPGT